MSPDKTRFLIDRIGCDAIPHVSPGDFLAKAFRDTPLHTEVTSFKSKSYERPIWTIKLWLGGRRLCELTVIEGVAGDLSLLKIDANLPALVHGHNGNLITCEADYILALTRLAHLADHILLPKNRGRLFRVTSRTPCWSFGSVELAAQVVDPDRRIILDSHLSQVKQFVSKPGIYPGESTTFKSTVFDLKAYAKDLQMNQREVELPPITRVEINFKRMRPLLRLIGTNDGVRLTALPFQSLLPAMHHLIKDRLVGGLAAPSPRCKSPRGAARRISDLWPTPAILHAALHAELKLRKGSKASKLRSTVFDFFAHKCETNLPELFAKTVDQFPHAVVRLPETEEHFNWVAETLGWPMSPDPEIARCFSEMRIK